MVTEEESSVTVASKENLLPSLSPDSTISAIYTDREVSTPTVQKKPSEDGYNWRKYGQKNVKGNEYIRSYYKCSYPNCYVKKQIERSHDGRITDVTYLGDHNHAKPHAEPEGVVPSTPSPRVKLLNCPPPPTRKDKQLDEMAPASDNAQPMDVSETAIVALPDNTTPILVTPFSHRRDERSENLTPKRRKKGADGVDITPEKPGQESRVVVQTVSEVDIVNDGYRWRKYGQKMVKGNPNPRSYYRCSTAGCPVKKHVERAAYDPKVVITTYEGEHDHTVPLGRTIVPQTPTPTPSSGGIESNGDGKSKSEETHAPLCITYPSDHTSKDKDTPAVVFKNENEKSTTDHDTAHDSANKVKDTPAVVIEDKNENPSTSHNVGPVSDKSTGGDNTDRMIEDTDNTNKANVEEEKGSLTSSVQANIAPEVSSTEEVSTDETNSKSVQMPGPEPVNC